MEGKKIKIIIACVIIVLIIAIVALFVMNKDKENLNNDTAQNTSNSQTDEQAAPIPDDEPIENPKNTEFTPIIE